MHINVLFRLVPIALWTVPALLGQAFSAEGPTVRVDSAQAGPAAAPNDAQIVFNNQESAMPGSAYPMLSAPMPNEITVFGNPQSLTSPSLKDAAKLKRQVPGGFTITENDRPEAENFKDLQKFTPGVFTQSDGGTEESRISVRGSGIQAEYEPLGLGLFLDGIPYNGADGAASLEDFDLSCIHYAETYRGAGAFRYGSSTLGGAMNLIPFTGYSGAPLSADVEAGTYGTVNSDLSIANVRGPYDYYASVTARYRNGGRLHSREDVERFFGNFGYRRGGGAENRLYLTMVNVRRQIPGELAPGQITDNPLQANPEFVSQDIGRSFRSLRLADKFSLQSGGRRFDAGAVWQYKDRDDKSFYSEESRAGISQSGIHNAALTLNLVNRSTLFGFDNRTTIGTVGSFERDHSVHFKNVGGKRGDSTAAYVTMAENIPVYAETQQYFGNRFSVLAGIQGVYSGRQFENEFRFVESEEEEEEEGEDENELDFFGVSPKFGFLFEAADDIQFFANGSRSWQPPSFSHLLGLEGEEEEEEEEEGDSASAVGFTRLKAQSAWSIEAGCRGNWKTAEWEFAVYRSWVRDELLSINDVHGNVLGTVNIPRTIHQGIEAGLSVDLLSAVFRGCKKDDRLLFNQCYTLNDFHFDNDSVYHYNRIGGLPEHIYNAQIKYEASSGFYFGPQVSCILSKYPADQANTLHADPYAVLNWSMGYTCKKGLSGYVEIKNMLGRHYVVGIEPIPDALTSEEGAAVFEPGLLRSFYCGLQWRW
jgi:iron complex outermembrane recepter protein